jgi:hypothetical protein
MYILKPGMYMQGVRPNARDGTSSLYLYTFAHVFHMRQREKDF